MKAILGNRKVRATFIGVILFGMLTNIQIPLSIAPEIAIQPRVAVMAFFSVIFGPVVGSVVGLAGHLMGDLLLYSSVWWSWAIAEALVGAAIGIFSVKYRIKEWEFNSPKIIILFNLGQVVANALAWILVAPGLDVLLYNEPVQKVYIQGTMAFTGNFLVIGILGTLLLAVYSRIAEKPEDSAEEDIIEGAENE